MCREYRAIMNKVWGVLVFVFLFSLMSIDWAYLFTGE